MVKNNFYSLASLGGGGVQNSLLMHIALSYGASIRSDNMKWLLFGLGYIQLLPCQYKV